MVPWKFPLHSVPTEQLTKGDAVPNVPFTICTGSYVCRAGENRSVGLLRSSARVVHSLRLFTPIRTAKAVQSAYVSCRALPLGCKLNFRWAYGDKHADQHRAVWDALINDMFEYKHTLYPQRMIGASSPCLIHTGPPVPPTRSRGLHTNHVFLGNDPLMIQGCNIMRSRGYPEGAVMLVDNKQAIEEVRHQLPALRGLSTPHGHCLVTAVQNVSWPQIPAPGCFAEEVWDGTFYRRGFATVEEDDGGVTFWQAWASADLMGSEFYERMKVGEGCEKGFVHILDSPEAVERICCRQADYLREVWMDPIVAHLLEHGSYPPGFEHSGITYEFGGSNPYEGLQA